VHDAARRVAAHDRVVDEQHVLAFELERIVLSLRRTEFVRAPGSA
jgi:hypothetical protein